MRIISGTHKGRRILAPRKLPVRPTTDMAKESLFNILNNHFYFKDVKVLDLFSGTGNLSYEFASRGVPAITAVDNHSGCIHFIAKTAEAFEFPIQPFKADVYDYLKKHQGQYDIIVADPPYDFEVERFREIVDLVVQQELLADDGMLIVEHASVMSLEDHPHFAEARKYGSSVFSFFRESEKE
ncbi:RsmD family RNA methyltransferase [Croceiramulus getboli]|nr:RsmD family RNA methyltransferase [Flavobacteriaceae bacterium YJPT1-3]